MSKVFIHKDNELEFSSDKSHSNVHTGSNFESAFSKEEMNEIAERVMKKHANTFKKLAENEKQEIVVIEEISSLKDLRVRRYAKALRKELNECAKNQSISLLNKRMDLQHETAGKFHAIQKADMLRLENEQSKLTHQLELIEQELKVKPVHIKETKTIERFDHRLVIFNIVLLFLNIILLLR